MHEPRTPSGPRRLPASIQQLLPARPSAAIAPDHPPKQIQAWVRKKQNTLNDIFSLFTYKISLCVTIPQTSAYLKKKLILITHTHINYIHILKFTHTNKATG